MELDAISGSWRLSPAEKARRKRLKLCDYCGGANHDVFHCPKRPQRKNTLIQSAIETELEAEAIDIYGTPGDDISPAEKFVSGE